MRSATRSFLVIIALTCLAVPAEARRRAVRSGPAEPGQVTTFDLIDRAATEGRISPDQAMLYKVFAIYGDPRFPEQFRGDDTGISDSLFVSEIAAKYETLSVDLQQQLAPFLIPPFHENSWWHLRSQANTRPIESLSMTSFGLTRPCSACSILADWEFVPTANGKVKVWYEEDDPHGLSKATAFANEIDNVIWPQLVGLMGREPLPDEGSNRWIGHQLGGDTRLDVALVDIDRSLTTARYPDDCDSAAWTYIQFNKTMPKEELAHELMHSFQYAFDVKVRDGECTGETEYRWLMEATAQWVEDFLYPTNHEQWAAPHFLAHPEWSLNERHDPHWYGAYLLPFFLARVKGDKTAVGRIWAKTEGAASLQAIEEALAGMGGFETVWPEFVLYNWNHDPVDAYQKIDNLGARPAESGDTLLAPGAMDKYATLKVELPHLSATYKHFVFNANVRSVAFLNGLTYRLSTTPSVLLNTFDLGLQYKFDAIPAEQKRGVSITAIIKKNGQWGQADNWTDVQYKPFCRQKPEENIEELVLIFANANHDETSRLQTPELPPMIIATDMGCRWEGTLDRVTSPLSTSAWGPFHIRYDLRREPRDPMEAKDYFLGYFYQTSGHAAWDAVGTNGPCSVNARNDNAAIAPDIASFSMNFAPQSSKGYRKAFFPSFLASPAKYTMQCGPAPFEVNAGVQGFPLADPLMFIGAIPGGSMQGTVTDPLGTWTWDFQPKP